MKVNILYLEDQLRVGGAERQLIELLKGLDKNKYNPNVGIFSTEGEFIDQVKEMGIPIYFFKRKWRWDLSPIFGLMGFIKEHKIEIIHTLSAMASFYGILAGRIANVITINGSIRGGRKQKFHRWCMQKWPLRISDLIISNSVAGVHNFGLTGDDRVRVVYNGIDFKRFHLKIGTHEKKKELGITSFSKAIGMVAGLRSAKDHKTFLEAADLVLRTFPNVCFLVVGSGEERYQRVIKDFIRDKGGQQNIFLLGNRNDVEEILSVLDISVLASAKTQQEGNSNSVLESMAMSLPVVASDSGGNKEVIVEGVTGYVVPPENPHVLAEKIVELLDDKELAQKMGRAGRKRVEQVFGLDRMVGEVENIYDSLLSVRQNGRR